MFEGENARRLVTDESKLGEALHGVLPPDVAAAPEIGVGASQAGLRRHLFPGEYQQPRGGLRRPPSAFRVWKARGGIP